MSEWQDISTAPKDGEMLVWSKQHGRNLVYCDDFIERDGRVEYWNGDVYCIAEKWTHEPEPPKEGE